MNTINPTYQNPILRLAINLLVLLLFSLSGYSQITLTDNPTAIEQYAAKELQRYYYQLSNQFINIEIGNTTHNKTRFILTTITNPLINNLIKSGKLKITQTPQPQGYIIKTLKQGNTQTILIAGGDDIGLLYGVYGFLEDHLDMRFYMSGDVFPEKKLKGKLPVINDERQPKMEIRGFLPWTNFSQSATIYSWNDWRYIIDQAAKMRMNFMLIHNYNGFCGHNEIFHNFEYDGHLSRGWMATVKTGHGWHCPPWEINEYRFGASEIYDDYDFGADYGLHNETLTNTQIHEKGTTTFRKVIDYAHTRGVKIGLGLDIDVILPEYGVEADHPGIVSAQTKEITTKYPNLDYLFCFQSESRKDSIFYAKWHSIFTGFYTDIKRNSPHTRIAVSGWGLTPESVAELPGDVICAPISHYSATFEHGSVYGNREYWGCPWLERDFNSSQYYYPYNMHLSETIKCYGQASANMTGFYALTWRLTDAVSPKMWYMSKAPWYDSDKLDTSEKVYRDFAKSSYGEAASEEITSIINQNEPFATDFAECVTTPKFDRMINTYPLFNISKITLSGHGKKQEIIATTYTEREGTQNAPCEEGGECVGYIMSGNRLKYENISFEDRPDEISIRIASASNGGVATLTLDAIDGPVIAEFQVKNTEGWQSWKTITLPISAIKGTHTLYISFSAFNDIENSQQVVNRQLATIDKSINQTANPANKQRLTHLRKRIEGVGYHVQLNDEFETYKWEDFPGKLQDWARTFLYRIDDISSYGNIMSTQNRFVKQNYISVIDSLRKQQRVKAPSHIVAKSTKAGALITWQNEEPAAEFFVICRDKQEIAKIPADRCSYEDIHHKEASYSVYVIDTDGNKSPVGIPYACKPGTSDTEQPVIIVTSPLTSIKSGQDLFLKISIQDDYKNPTGQIYFRKTGTKQWKSLPLEHRTRAVFAAVIPALEISPDGIEYYIEVSDAFNKSLYPALAPEITHTVIVTGQADNVPDKPQLDLNNNNRIRWKPVPGADTYKIYRSPFRNFTPGPVSFVTFVPASTTSFRDNGFNFDGTPLKGKFYYKITAVDRFDNESDASEGVLIENIP